MASFCPHYCQWSIIINSKNGSRKSSGLIQIPLKSITQDFFELQYGQNSAPESAEERLPVYTLGPSGILKANKWNKECKAHNVMLTLPCSSYQHTDNSGTCAVPLQASQKTLGQPHKHDGAELNRSLPKPEWNLGLVEQGQFLFSTNTPHWQQVDNSTLPECLFMPAY